MKKTKVHAYVQARMGSTRYPGKIMEMIEYAPMYYWVVSRLERVEAIDKIVVLTSHLDQEDPLILDCNLRKIECFQGDERDVLDRYYQACLKYEPDVVLRITSDCPLIDPGVVSDMIQVFMESKVDYMCNFIKRRFPRGLDCEIMTSEALVRAHKLAQKEYQREHVTPYLYENPHEFKIKSYENTLDESKYRLTVDTRDDLELIRSIVDLAPNHKYLLDYHQIIKIINDNKYLLKINQHIKQKPLQY